VKELLDAAFVKADEAEARARDKLSTMRESWQAWGAAIKEALASRKRVRPEALIDVPKDWRIWAVERYFNEHSAEGLAMEEGELVAFGGNVSKGSLGDLLKGLVSSAKIDGGAIIGANGGLLAAELPRGANKAVVAKMASRAAQSAAAVTSVFGTQQKYVLASMAKGKLLVIPAGKAILVFLLPPEANVAQVLRSTDNIARIVSEIIEE
jgi:predicted regulator of Ras-like GTPase activity (Roadblock/LC7/MglB family)